MVAYVYILCCRGGSYYVGSARGDLARRVAEHNSGKCDGYTARRRPVELVFHQEFDRVADAVAAERQIKGWRRAKKEALMRGDFALLSHLAKRGRRYASFETPPDGGSSG
jgi:predicted GIY-YIG superfamily endonuclease